MRTILEQRLRTLQSEQESGQILLANLDAKRAELDARRLGITQTLLRIEGAVAVLREMLAAEAICAPTGAAEDRARPGDDLARFR
jgi:hypothetical protein